MDAGKVKLLGLSAVTMVTTVCGVSMGTASAAEPAADAGSIHSEVNQEREWIPKSQDNDNDVKVDMEHVDKTNGSNVTVNVREVRLQVEDKAVSPEELQAVLKDVSMGDKNFSQIQSMADKLTEYLHKKGYMTAQAYLPTQEIANGVITINVVLGHYGDTVFENTSGLATSRAEGFTHPSKKGRLIRRDEMERLLLIMNDIPGVKAHAYVFPGKVEGTADVRYELTTTEKQEGYLYTDNYGNRLTGRWRIGGSWSYNNLSHVGDQLSLSYIQSSNHLLRNYDFRYELPVGNFGTVAGIEIYRTNYDIVDSDYGEYGIANGLRLYTRNSLKRTRNNNLFFLAELERNRMSDRNTFYEKKISSNALRLGLEGDNRTRKSASSYRLMHSIGRLSLDNATAWYNDFHNTRGTWQKTFMDVYHIQNLNPRLDLHMHLKAQYPWTNLDSSEKMYISGYNGVRAFPVGEGGGDKGVLGSLELRYQTGSPYWQLAAFWDGGWVQTYRNAIDGDTDRTKAMHGLGIGAIWRNTKTKSYARLDYAYPLGNRYSKSYKHNIGGTVWFRFIQQF